MDDLNDPRISAYKPQRRLLVPKPPGYRNKRSRAQREQLRKQEARNKARIARFHLVGLTTAAVIVLGCSVLALVIVMLVLLVTRH
jgi:hypothetical protein